MKTRWKIMFYRDEAKTDWFLSCIVWTVDADAAIIFCKDYFKLKPNSSPYMDVRSEENEP